MKPKERFYGYALLSANRSSDVSRDVTDIRDETPIDLSTKKSESQVYNQRSISPFNPNDFEHLSTHYSHPIDWSTKYLLSNNTTTNLQIEANPNILPYLLLNRNRLDVNSPDKESDIVLRNARTDIIYDQFGNPYKVGPNHSLIPLNPSPYIDLYKSAQNGSHISLSPNNTSSNSSSPSTNSTNNSHNEYHETKRLLQQSPEITNSSLFITPNAPKVYRSHNLSNKTSNERKTNTLVRSSSFPSLISAINFNKSLSKSRSESSLHFMNFEKYEQKVSYKPKSLAISRYSNGEHIERIAAQIWKNNQQRVDYNKHYYKHNKRQNITDSDIEKEDIIESGVSDDYGSDDALDLRVSHFQTITSKRKPDLSHADPEHLFHEINTFLNEGSSPAKDELLSPSTNPLDLYRHYYYYLMHQPTLASRAVAAVAVAETYAKLMSNSHQNHNSIDDNNSIDNCDNNTSIYESENQSPDYLISGSRAELRLADTTNNGIPFDRKRISRPLTGKHVKHGTGASPSTLVSLRNMIQQRQRLKEIGALDGNKYGKGKGGKRIKRK